jgi:hypothetical protein
VPQVRQVGATGGCGWSSHGTERIAPTYRTCRT